MKPASEGPGRRSPLVPELILLALFLAFLGIGVATVLVPELTSDDGQEARASEGAAEPAPAAAPEP